jgi:hypothetical protein
MVLCPEGRKAVLDAPPRCMGRGDCQLDRLAGAVLVYSAVGCAAAMIRVAPGGSKEATCGSDRSR